MAFGLRRLLGSNLFDRISGPSSARLLSAQPIRATLFPGDGIGPEIADSVKETSIVLLPAPL